MIRHGLIGLLFVCFSVSVFAAPALTAGAFSFQDMAGQDHKLSEYKGRWVIVNYWATWCPPCLEEIPDLVAIYDERKDQDVMVIGVAFDYETAQAVTDYVDDMLVSYPIALGNEEIVKQIGSAAVLPATYLYNPDGELVKVKRGLVTRQYLEGLMQR